MCRSACARIPSRSRCPSPPCSALPLPAGAAWSRHALVCQPALAAVGARHLACTHIRAAGGGGWAGRASAAGKRAAGAAGRRAAGAAAARRRSCGISGRSRGFAVRLASCISLVLSPMSHPCIYLIALPRIHDHQMLDVIDAIPFLPRPCAYVSRAFRRSLALCPLDFSIHPGPAKARRLPSSKIERVPNN